MRLDTWAGLFPTDVACGSDVHSFDVELLCTNLSSADPDKKGEIVADWVASAGSTRTTSSSASNKKVLRNREER